MSIWCFYVSDDGRGKGNRQFHLYNDEVKEIRILGEQDVVRLLQKKEIQNLKLNPNNSWVEGRTGTLDKITNKAGYLVMAKIKDNTDEVVGVRILDSKGCESVLPLNEAMNLLSTTPAQNAKIPMGRLMGINWSIPETVIKVKETLFCTVMFNNWGDFKYSLIDNGDTYTLSLVAKQLFVQIECPLKLVQPLENIVRKRGLSCTKSSLYGDSVVFVSFDMGKYNLLNVLKEMSKIGNELDARCVFSNNFMKKDIKWCESNVDLTDFYESLDPTRSIEYHPLDMTMDICAARIFRGIGGIIYQKTQNLCEGLHLDYAPALTVLIPSEVKEEFPKLAHYDIGCEITKGLVLSLTVKKYKRPKKEGFFSRMFK